jgi:hypothetical protein
MQFPSKSCPDDDIFAWRLPCLGLAPGRPCYTSMGTHGAWRNRKDPVLARPGKDGYYGHGIYRKSQKINALPDILA